MWLPGLLIGMTLHGLWNGSMVLLAFIDQEITHNEIVSRVGMIVLSLIYSAAWVTLSLILRRSERMHTQNMLGDYANSGWLTHAEVDMRAGCLNPLTPSARKRRCCKHGLHNPFWTTD